MNKRVVVTGMGALTPIGNTVGEFWDNVKNGKNGIDFITRFDTADMDVKIAGEVKNLNFEDFLDRKELKRMDKFSQYAIIASKEAVENSGIDIEKLNSKRFGVIVGSGIGGLCTMEEQIIRLNEKGPRRVAPLFIPMSIVNMAAGHVAIQFGAKGICTSVVTACASGTNAIGEGYRNIKYGYSDVILAGGAEASISKIGIAGFTTLKTLSESDDVNRASIPFDKEREGFVMGEGAGIVVLEELEHALSRNATIYAEVVGYGATCDAYHMTSPVLDGSGAAEAMTDALNEANIDKKDITYINAHGTGTPVNDKTETLAIKNVFGDYAYEIPVSSTKSMTGHLLGATGAVEAIATILTLMNDFVHPTININVPDEECDLNYVPGKGIGKKMKYALSNSFGFGGHNGVLCLKKWEA